MRVLRTDGYSQSGGLNRICNLLCSNASKDFVVLMADNIDLSDGWYDTIKEADYFDVIGSRLVTNNGARAVDWACQVRLGSMSVPYPLDYEEWTTKAYVSGKLMLLRKGVWEQIKFAETNLPDDHDVEFCLRATKAGFRVGVMPQAEAIYHLGPSETATDVTFEKSQRMVRLFGEALAAGKGAFKSADYETALAHLANATEIAPDDARALSLIGWTHYFSGRYEKAVEVLSEALAVECGNHYALRGRGWAFLQSGGYRHAISDLTAALGLIDPNCRDDWLETVRGLAWSHYHDGNFDEATRHFSAILERSHSQEMGLRQDLYRGLGWSCYRKGMLAEAAGHFKNALSNIDPRNQDLVCDAKRGFEVATLGQAKIQDSDRHPLVDLSKTRLRKPSLTARIEWRGRLVSVLKAAIRKIPGR
jgi:Tfp pilus assembly protein PilF